MPETTQSDLVERLRQGVIATGLHEDNETELFLVDDASDTIMEAAAEISRLTEALAGMTKNRDNLRIYLAERTEERDAARDQAVSSRKAEQRAREAASALLASKVEGDRAEVLMLRKALRRCDEIVEHNLHRQNEKVSDVSVIARRALNKEQSHG